MTLLNWMSNNPGLTILGGLGILWLVGMILNTFVKVVSKIAKKD